MTYRKGIGIGFAAVAIFFGAPNQALLQAEGDDIIEIPGLGFVSRSEFPDDMQPFLRGKDTIALEPAEPYGDLLPAPFASTPDSVPLDASVGSLSVLEAQFHNTCEADGSHAICDPRVRDVVSEGQSRAKRLKRLDDERSFPNTEIPQDAYQKAWRHLQLMQEASPPAMAPAEDTPELENDDTQSRWSWLENRLSALLPIKPAFAQPPPTYQWYQIGPQPLLNENGIKNAGIFESVTPDPQQPTSIVYGTTFDGGIWKGTNLGSTPVWTTLTDSQPSLQYSSLAVHPQNSQWLLAGSGRFQGIPSLDQPKWSIGIIRSTDGGNSWCQIGPLCPDDANCPPANPNYALSNLSVGRVAVENTGPNYRVWAATSKGLWWSDNAARLNSPVSCSQVTWTKANLPAKKSNGVTPDSVNQIFISPSNPLILYASVVNNDKTSGNNNGWWRSTNRDAAGSWTQVLPLQLGDWVGRSAIRNNATGPDILWSIMAGTSFCMGNNSARLYRSVNSGVNWSLLTTSLDCTFLRSVAIDPTDANVVAVGREPLFRSLNGLAASPTFSQVSNNDTLHVDHNGLAFAAPGVLYDGNDGGMWQITSFGGTPSLINLNTSSLGNAEFYHGATDPLNYGVSFGGTQDNSTIRGGAPLQWDLVMRGFSGDADGTVLIDPRDSNIVYFATFQNSYAIRGVRYSTASPSGILSTGFTAPIRINSLAMDPSTNGGNKVLVAFSSGAQKVFRTTNADSTGSWSSITTDTGETGNTLPGIGPLAVAPLSATQAAPSNQIFGASETGNGVWCTSNAALWRGGLGVGNPLPTRRLTSIAVGTSSCSPAQQACTASCPCTLYVSVGGFDASPSVPSHVFRSGNYTGQNCSTLTWQNVSGVVDTCTGGICPSTGRACVSGSCPFYLPDIPATEVVVDTANPNFLYLATDMGIYQGCLGCRSSDGVNCTPSVGQFICHPSGTVWAWDTMTQGFPKAAWVTDLSFHHDSRTLRAWTYGRSVWELNLGNIPNPDCPANTTTPVTETQSPSLSSTTSGDKFAVAWADDRNGSNQWNIYYRTASADGIYLNSTDKRVDDTSAHVAQGAAVATNFASTTHQQCSWVAWHDDRLDVVNHYNHIYYTYICGDGYKPYADMRADTQATNLNATYPALVFQPAGVALASVVAWQGERPANPAKRDIFARLFSAFGPAIPPLQVNSASTTSDTTLPSMAADASNNTYITWEEYEPGPSPQRERKIFLRKYDSGMNPLSSPIRIDSGANPATTDRFHPRVAVDNQTGTDGPTIVLVWHEAVGGGAEYVVYRRLRIQSSGNALFLDGSPQQVNDPPSFPAGVQRAVLPSVAADSLNNFAIAWGGYVSGLQNGFAKSYTVTPAVKQKDHRIDLAGRASVVGAPKISRNSQTGKFTYAWRDTRNGFFNVYTRGVNSAP